MAIRTDSFCSQTTSPAGREGGKKVRKEEVARSRAEKGLGGKPRKRKFNLSLTKVAAAQLESLSDANVESRGGVVRAPLSTLSILKGGVHKKGTEAKDTGGVEKIAKQHKREKGYLFT